MMLILTGVFLTVSVWFDFRTRTVPRIVIILGVLIIGVFGLCSSFNWWSTFSQAVPDFGLGMLTIKNRLIGVLIGGGVLLLSVLLRGRIGLGDGAVLCITGFALGWRRNFEMLFFALVFSCIFSCFILLVLRRSKKTIFPFIPFLFGGYLSCVLMHLT